MIIYHCRSNFANVFREFKDIVSYGSCQFPTLGFVVERYKAIEQFVVEQFWKLVVRERRAGVDVIFEWDRVRLFDRDVVQVSDAIFLSSSSNFRVVALILEFRYYL